MKEWLIRLTLVAALIAVGFWTWRTLYPNPEKLIRKRLGELAKAASFSHDQGLVAQAWNASEVGEFFTPDVEVTVEVPGSQQTFNGREEIQQAAVTARKTVSSLTVEFPDIKVTVAPDKANAVVYLTARGKVPGEKDFFLQELRVTMTRVKRDWLINRVETVKTLSQRPLVPAA